MKYIAIETAPKAVGPYTQAIISNGFIFCSGQIGLDPKTNELVDGLEAQVHQVLRNLTEVLKAGNSSLESIVKTTVYLVDINDYVKMNEIYGQYFSEHKPARAAFAVAHLPKNALIEIEVVAEVKK
ncbi:MAG TPA: RidA family protein [Candidatus Sulfotelmatobacter sp.]|jgi:2-iminobutanoate/2-iminopropanoate deaminase|nr:RidA family protein [Candidatus Sulfotelmatobacter sp.]